MATPAAALQAIEVTLSVFGGSDTEIAPSDVPEGLSPDNQDMIFLPGETSSRPGLNTVFQNGFPDGVSVTYEKTYVQPNGNPLNLVLTSDGRMWLEDVVNNPFNYSLLSQFVTPGLYAQSISAFGREYIAFSDLLHGQGVPLQFDGVNFDRVSQDGPGAAVTLSDYSTTHTIALIAAHDAVISSISEVGNLVTVVTSTPHGFSVNQSIFVGVAVGSGYNGWQEVGSVLSPTKFTFTLPTTGLGPAATGFVSADFVVQTSTPHGLNIGDSFQVAGTGVFDSNNSQLVNSPFYSVSGLNGPNVAFFIPLTLTAAGITAVVTGGGTAVGGTLTAGGQSSIGMHRCVQMFLTRQGYLTKPSPIASLQSNGNTKFMVDDLAIGPGNVVARLLAFTGSGGDNFFTLPASTTLQNPSGAPIVTQAFLIPNNSDSSAIIDFSDNALFAGIPIDVVGNDLFDLVTLQAVLGFFAYASRLMAWGDVNNIENLLSMGFEGGFHAGDGAHPLGWRVDSAGGAISFSGAWAAGLAWGIAGDGSASPRGEISQSFYQDEFNDPIATPGTAYVARLWAKSALLGLAGNVVAKISSVLTGFQSTATIPIAGISVKGEFHQAAFDNPMPSVIPADMRLTFYAQGHPVGTSVTLDEMSIVFAEKPYTDTLARVSYAVNPEAFALTTGNLGAADDQSPLRCFSLQRKVGLLHTGEATHEFQDNNFEPGDGDNAWPVDSLTRSVGAVSLKACDPGKFGTGDAAEDWDIIASKNGLYLHLGADFWKISQEFSRTVETAPDAVTWDDINWAVEQTVWIKNDPGVRRAYVGVPVHGATAPNAIFVVDYREMDTAAQIASAAPIHITLAGKMKSSDLARKWTRWNIKANCGEILVRPGNERAFILGGGSGSTPGTGVAYGNIYSLDSAKLTDDDYGAIVPSYLTYAFVDHDTELQLQLGSARHLYSHISAYITGVGLVSITPYVNSLSNPLPPTSFRQLRLNSDTGNAQPNDLEWTIGVRGQRVFFRISVQPLPGQTDVQLKLQKLIIKMSKDPVILYRNMGI